ncbi:hypothetical protein VPH35_120086 [Triticum aestivum]
MATARRRKAKAARATAAEAMKKATKNAYAAMVIPDEESRQAKAEAKEATTTAAAKAEESMQAARTAMAKAEETAIIANVKAEEAKKATEAYREVCRQEDAEAEWAQCEEELFAAQFRRYWNKLVARPGVTFHETTSIPAMRYTHPAPQDSPKAMATLQITSVKVAAIDDCLRWPLQVYGIIAARDVLDHKRNILFHRRRGDCQIITQEACSLPAPSATMAWKSPVDSGGVVKLQRRVVSVYIEGMLKVSVVACPVDEERGFIQRGEAVFKPKRQGVNLQEIQVGSCSMQITVAWSCFRYE